MKNNLIYSFLTLLVVHLLIGNNLVVKTELALKCLDSDSHKPQPEPAESLAGECAKWSSLSCCNKNTTESIHLTEAALYKFNYNHCFELSAECKRKFTQEWCMYECDPYLGKFMVGDLSKKFRKERYFKIPLCKRDCESWFDACKYDYTCRDNWNKGFKWESGKNSCYEQDACKTFKDTFGNAKQFCSSIWDESFEMVESEKADECFSFDFDSNSNPNEKAAQFYDKKV